MMSKVLSNKLKITDYNSICIQYFFKVIIFITITNLVVLSGDLNLVVDAAASIHNIYDNSFNNRNGDGSSGDGHKSATTYEEYILEHEVSQKEAQYLFNEVREIFLNTTPPAWCKECSWEEKKYCLGPYVMHDHCCCDQRHGEDIFKWIAHTCYVAHKPCSAHIGSCLKYAEVRQCCCDRYLAEKWYDTYSGSTQLFYNSNTMAIIIFVIIISIEQL